MTTPFHDDLMPMRIRRLEFNWHFTTSEGERVLNYDLESNAEEIREGVDGWFWIKTKEALCEIHKVTNVNSVMYERPEVKDE
jgi:hypothetical protein